MAQNFPDCTGIWITGFRFTEGPLYLHLIHIVSAVVYLLRKEVGKAYKFLIFICVLLEIVGLTLFVTKEQRIAVKN